MAFHPKLVPHFQVFADFLLKLEEFNRSRKKGGNVALASRSARHTNLQATMCYIHTAKDELYESIERADNRKLLNRILELQESI